MSLLRIVVLNSIQDKDDCSTPDASQRHSRLSGSHHPNVNGDCIRLTTWCTLLVRSNLSLVKIGRADTLMQDSFSLLYQSTLRNYAK